MKRFLSVILVLGMVCGLLPAAAITANAEHQHIAATDVWIKDDSGHWNPCYQGGGCDEKMNYAPHSTGEYSKMCSVCGRIDHVCYNPEATCEIGGRCIYCPYGAPENPDNHVTYGTMIDDATHKIVCGCGYVKVASEPHVLNSWDDIEGKPGMEESWCEVCFHAVMRPKQHSHSYSKATCTSPAKCSCGATTGDKNPSNHTGGTEVKGAVAATEDNEGYTGDTYCKGCGVKTKTGERIPKKASGTTTPGTAPSTPGTGPSTPGTAPSTPGTGSSMPGTEPSTPGVESTDPSTGVATQGTDPTDHSTPGADSTAPNSVDKNDSTTAPDKNDPDKDDSGSDGDSLLWLWILLIVAAAGGAVTVVILMKKKKNIV